MSGIAGIVDGRGRHGMREWLARTLEAMASRGPDDRRTWCGPSAGLAHASLRTTRESSDERQPATLDESIRLFEEGMRLSGVCQKRLDEADRKIETLLRKPGGVEREIEDESGILDKEG